ncbi:MAG: RsmB/NOP family class I SAM-dependent RNA methyltransferase [Anaeromicrobium sp.]|jgi:NOL1/NOP2/sun family putative RNA methylase|uniref:RsmF rRNA methyltransferase first C-terminal domain-containing protein n=1 Tax=Anaeromicrobium sp. TaxID=1929132 RepID=UPI0025F7F724|nr:RsmB/NOP family class I SAM-dependent RNA methyltransferase [Anaeromicrobium sp.]MCT4592994.1 RsmB/NOP family class I SAM-dependent RNA methyltransferase [Anaeromicrobium sp.]
MNLPKIYLDKMKELLKDEYDEFMDSYNYGKIQGLRVNTLKISVEEFLKISPFKLVKIPWCETGFYYEENERPAKHAYYHAGLYYIQEPSAMLSAEVLKVEPGDRVLDLCAAPGGKTTQIGGKLKGEGILITNDIKHSRTKALLKNVELCGIKNAIVINGVIEDLNNSCKNFFNKVLIDAPCSGEGMFRKDPSMVKSWEKTPTSEYSNIQKDILSHVDKVMSGDSRLVYSTCTFSPDENEEIIHHFLEENTEYDTIEIEKNHGLMDGLSEFVSGDKRIEKSIRLWPHKLKGEGHFVAVLKKDSNEVWKVKNKDKKHKPLESFNKFVEDNLNCEINGEFREINENLYMVPDNMPNLAGIRVIRSGWLLGKYKKNRFEPSQAFAMGLTWKDAKRVVNFSCDDPNTIKYLKGETINVESEKGWTLVCVDNYPIGWAKQMGNTLKNYYPAPWRWM